MYTKYGDKMDIREVIVVEGKHDTATLQQYFEVDTIETNGSALNDETLNFIAMVQKQRGVIIFTDPDFPGNKIRNTINATVDGCKNAFLPQEKAKGKKKIGIEHASKEDLWEALSHVVTFTKDKHSDISMQDMIELGLSGTMNSAEARKKICDSLHIAPCNAKTLYKRLRLMQLQKTDVYRVAKETL